MLLNHLLVDHLQSRGHKVRLLDKPLQEYSWAELMGTHEHALAAAAEMLGDGLCANASEFERAYTPQLMPHAGESDVEYDRRLARYADHGYIPALDGSGQKLLVCSNPLNPVLDDETIGKHVIAPASIIESVLRGTRNTQSDIAPFDDSETVDSWLSKLFRAAHERRAADIEITSMQSDMRVRFKVNGRWTPWLSKLPLTRRSALLRSLCSLAIPPIDYLLGADHDFKVERRIGGIDTSWRGAITPAALGDSVTLRSLPQIGKVPTLEELGYSDLACDIIRRTQSLRDGLILVTGPTGSGKTTTLYSIVTEQRDSNKKVFTVEDPVEMVIPGVVQKPVFDDETIDSKYRVSFAGGLRAAMRHAPDVLVVGEARDNETAYAAVAASRSGHLTYTTLHTSTIPTSIKRMLDLGVSPAGLADTLSLVISQNLVRTLCPHCRIEHASGEASRNVDGCQNCAGTGEHGRTVVYEIAMFDDEARESVIDGTLRQHLQRLRDAGRYIDKSTSARQLVATGRVDRREVEGFFGGELHGAGNV